MPGGFPFSGAPAGGGGGSGGGGSRQQATYVWDLLPYSRRSVGFTGSNNQQQQGASGDLAAETGGAATASSAIGGSGDQQQQQPPPPRQLTESEASLLEQLYRRKVRESSEKYELVATFRLRSGRVHAFHVYRTRVPFQLTERRKKLLRDYYSQGSQDVALYVNQAEFEHYMPLTGSIKKQRNSGDSTSPTVTQTRSVNGLKSFLGIS